MSTVPTELFRPTKNAKAAGTRRELQEVAHWRDKGFVAFRSPASLGCADVIAMKLDCNRQFMKDGKLTVCPLAEVHLIEVKANHGNPYMNFRKDARETLRAAAKQAGARAVLVHWPPFGERQELPEEVWP